MDLSLVDNSLVDQADNGKQKNLVHLLFHSLRGPSEHDRPASLPSLRQSSGGIVSRSAGKGPVGGGSSDSRLGFPLFTMQGGPAGHLDSLLALTEVIAVASQCHESRDGDRAIERRVGVRRFGEWPGTEIDVFGNFEPLRFEYFYVLFEKKIPKKTFLGRLLVVAVKKCTSRL
jgi:hypothetical protein